MREELDPHVVIGVMLNALKSMARSPLFEVYTLIHETGKNAKNSLCFHFIYYLITTSSFIDDTLEINEDYVQSKAFVCGWLVQMSQERLELARAVLGLCARIVSSSGHDGVLAEALAYTLSPYLSRPADSAFLSLRHKEHLCKARPVIAFLIVNFSDIFSVDLRARKVLVVPTPPIVVSMQQQQQDAYTAGVRGGGRRHHHLQQQQQQAYQK